MDGNTRDASWPIVGRWVRYVAFRVSGGQLTAMRDAGLLVAME
jgi:hypothetical protein